MRIGEIIKKVRKDAKKGQHVLTEILDCDQSTISRIENCKQSLSIERLKAFADYFQLDLSALLENEIKYLDSKETEQLPPVQKSQDFVYEPAYWKRVRKEQGVSKETLAKMLGHNSGRIVTNWEEGHTYPELADFQKMLWFFDVDLNNYVDFLFKEQKEALLADLNNIKKLG
jgi:transcriptional regulator with XRE-family HTH domain